MSRSPDRYRAGGSVRRSSGEPPSNGAKVVGKSAVERRPRVVPGAVGLGGEQVEGHHAVLTLLSVGARRVRRVWAQEAKNPSAAHRSIFELASRLGLRVEMKDRDAVLAASMTGAAQGVIAWADPVAPIRLEDLVGRAVPKAFLLVLDGVTDPGNFGAVLRTAASAGAHGVVIARHRSAPLTPAAVKAAAGAVELVPIAQVPGIPSALSYLSKVGIWRAGLDPTAPTPLWGAPLLDEPVALVLGAEGGGISRLARERCDIMLRIPQARAGGSLNVSAAAAVACFEVTKMRSASDDGPTAGLQDVH